MLEPVMRRHGMFWTSPQLSLATLDHAIWWHRDIDMSDWVLAEPTSPRRRAVAAHCSVLSRLHICCHHVPRGNGPVTNLGVSHVRADLGETTFGDATDLRSDEHPRRFMDASASD